MIEPADIVEERTWHIDVNGRATFEGTYRPDGLRELALGRLLAEGFIDGIADVRELEIDERRAGTARMRATIAEPALSRALREREHRRQEGCGLLHWVSCAPQSLRRERREPPPGAAAFRDLFRELFAAADRESPRGGVHAAALSDGQSLMVTQIDIGRHNATDKVMGRALLDELPIPALGLLVTARISAEIARKAACAGVSWVASRSTPSTLALRIANAAGLPLIARAARGRKSS